MAQLLTFTITATISQDLPPTRCFIVHKKVASAGPQGPFDIVWTFPSIYFACNLTPLANAIQNILSVSLHIPHDSICSDFPCLQQTPLHPQRVSSVNQKRAIKFSVCTGFNLTGLSSSLQPLFFKVCSLSFCRHFNGISKCAVSRNRTEKYSFNPTDKKNTTKAKK